MLHLIHRSADRLDDIHDARIANFAGELPSFDSVPRECGFPSPRPGSDQEDKLPGGQGKLNGST